MKASIGKRFIAFLIDIAVVGFLFSLLSSFLPNRDQITMLQNRQNELSHSYLKQELSFSNYFESYAELNHQIEQEREIHTIINFVLIFLYFVITPLLSDGQTFGCKLCKIQIVSTYEGKLSFSSTLIRSIILYGLGYLVALLPLSYLLDSVPYFIVMAILGFIQFLLVIISGFMVLYRKDALGLQDILSKTRVIANY